VTTVTPAALAHFSNPRPGNAIILLPPLFFSPSLYRPPQLFDYVHPPSFSTTILLEPVSQAHPCFLTITPYDFTPPPRSSFLSIYNGSIFLRFPPYPTPPFPFFSSRTSALRVDFTPPLMTSTSRIGLGTSEVPPNPSTSPHPPCARAYIDTPGLLVFLEDPAPPSPLLIYPPPPS